jgi:hypothetical protein
MNPRVRNLIMDKYFIRSALASVSIALGVVTVQRLWFIRQVRDVEKDAKEEEIQSVPLLADDSDTELWEEEENPASTVTRDSEYQFESLSIDDLLSERYKSVQDKNL